MIVDYPPSVEDTEEFNTWLNMLVGQLRFPDSFEAQTIFVPGPAYIANYNMGFIGGWQVTENTIAKNTITLDAANNRITVDDIIIDGGENEIRVADKILIDADTERVDVGDRDGTYVQVDGENTRIQSSNYVTGITGAGFHLSPSLLETSNIACRGIFRTAVFQKDVVSAVGGNLMVRPSDVLDTAMTALDASTLTIEGNETFAVGDFLRIKDGTDDEWLEVTGIGDKPTYAVTRDKAADYSADDNPAWTVGATVVNYGASGEGGILMTSSESNAPYVTVFSHAGAPWTTQTTQVRLGNLNGYLGYAAETYGLGIGSSSANQANLTFDPTNGIRLRTATTDKIVFDNSGNAYIAGTVTIGGSSGVAASSVNGWSHASDATKIDGGDMQSPLHR